MKDAVKKQVERAVSKAAGSIFSIIKVFEEHGSTLTDADTRKIFNHLTSVVNSAYVRAGAIRQGAAVGGAFTLDDEPAAPAAAEGVTLVKFTTPFIEPSITIPFVAPPLVEPPAPPPPAPPEKKWVKPEGRLAGSEGKVLVYPTEQPRKPRPAPPEKGEVPDPKTGFLDMGFLDN